MPYIPGTQKSNSTKKRTKEDYKRISPIYVPANVRATTDLSEFYEKAPQEMSRYELKELERILMMTEEDIAAETDKMTKELHDKYGDNLSPEEVYKLTDEYKGY